MSTCSSHCPSSACTGIPSRLVHPRRRQYSGELQRLLDACLEVGDDHAFVAARRDGHRVGSLPTFVQPRCSRPMGVITVRAGSSSLAWPIVSVVVAAASHVGGSPDRALPAGRGMRMSLLHVSSAASTLTVFGVCCQRTAPPAAGSSSRACRAVVSTAGGNFPEHTCGLVKTFT